MRQLEGYGREVQRAPASCSTADVHLPASNTAAIVTYTSAGTGKSNTLGQVTWSYDGVPTGGNLKIEDGSGNTIFSADITSGGPGSIIFDPPKRGSAATALIVTLHAGGSGVSGKLSCTQWTELSAP